eukprot:c20336_g1_i1.p1 GENE.c20336_g1_i1~~c20336_g1_i1.p1  ORF type:complete len:760 (+),score=209.14 c20336_g1_i1:133-2412(+)
MASAAANKLQLCTTQGYGTSGRPIDLVSNFYAMTIKDSQTQQYRVDFTPEIGTRKVQEKVLRLLSKQKEIVFIFDGGSFLFSKSKFPNLSHEIEFSGTKYVVDVKHTGTIKTQNLPPTASQLMHIIVSRSFHAKKFVLIQRKHFDPKTSIAIPKHGVEIWSGYSAAVVNSESGIVLNVDVAKKILRTENVLNFIKNVQKDLRGGNLQDKLTELLVGSIVMTRYNNRTYRIDKVDSSKNPSFSFEYLGQKITLAQYLKTKYSITLKDMQQPILVSQKKGQGDILLIPECCSMTGLTDEMIKDFRVMQDISEHTRVGPQARLEQIRSLRDAFKDPKVQTILGEYGVSIEPNLKSLKGRVLEQETICLKQKTQKATDKANWDNLMRSDEILQAVHLKDWGFVYTSRDSETAQSFLSGLKRIGNGMKIRIDDPVVSVIDNDRTESYVDAFKKILKPVFQIAVFLVPGLKKDRYDQLKQLLTSSMPIPSQCIQTKTLQNEKRFNSVCNKICLQIQAKCGGQIWKVAIPITKFMVVGIDVYHDTVNKGQSVLAFCASYNDSCTKYYSIPSFHRTGQEISANLRLCMAESLKHYSAINGGLPEKIFIYRDGVGDGQIDAVFKMEVPHINEAFTEFKNYAPKLAVIIVKKRISARFFDERAVSNVPPGTVIDRDVVPAKAYSFYLIAQSVTQGSATPTQYHVIVDNTGLKPDHLQILTFKLCHLYVNWSGTVRVPAPCQYAHKYALLIGQSIHRTPAKRLCSTLHFL